jgi:RimJ/RimL family protein N-acetyltransferase
VRVKKIYNALTARKDSPFTPHEIRGVRSDDMPRLNELVSSIAWETRFAFDTHFPRDKVRQLYVLWLERCFAFNSDLVLVFEQAGEIKGMCAGSFSPEKKSGTIELTAVGEKHTGQDYGASLAGATTKKLVESGALRVSVATQTRNCAAQALYEKCGFITASTDAWYHKWYF